MIYRLEKAALSTEAAEPSSETAEPSADTAKPSSEIAKPKPAHGDSALSSEPGLRPPRAVYGDSAASTKPGFHAPEPSIQSAGGNPQTAKPNRDTRARGRAQERLRRCAGLRGFVAKTS